jgi:hypothetical protein
MELTLQGKSLVFAKNGVFKVKIRVCIFIKPNYQPKNNDSLKGFI